MSAKTVLLVPFSIEMSARWDLAAVVRTGPDMADIHIFGPRRNHGQEVVTKMEAFARVLLGPCRLRQTHMPLTRRVPAPEHYAAYMASNLQAFLRACRAHTSDNGVLHVGWMHDFAPACDYDNVMAMHALARAHQVPSLFAEWTRIGCTTQAAPPAKARQELSACSSPASVEEAGPSASKRKVNSEDSPSKTT
ncbi:hypothetical protein SDRG_16970 [Saprolegnia diclina VS20]|uniref:Uncharacterized protein n=1 Tax=Saprolegnia diclina (strain VS20) TaxID=1156394 RepID=T0QZG1_SAPDV|nr:hypothetical protein SDRG_16970 [Saprolegnia diclina VS20]EQC25138.1 hypothetical protein SDRG_16970 [Saprolegnia diclina VS20]|eukprot:XP_008621420.1 hypothetical protein SDRG_16970 [Saprolegnia diclina VS20]